MKTHPVITSRKVEELIPYARNSRTHSDDQVAQIAASIREFGWYGIKTMGRVIKPTANLPGQISAASFVNSPWRQKRRTESTPPRSRLL